MRKTVYYRFLLAAGALLMPLLTFGAANDNPQISLMDQEIKYEKEKAEYLQTYVLDKILGPRKANVIVDVEFGLETKTVNQAAKEKKTEKKKRLGEVEYLLPGVPNPKSVTQESAPGESKEESGQAEETKYEVRTVIKRQIVTVLHDERVIKERLDMVRDAIVVSLKINEKRGDKIEFRKTKFTPGFTEEVLKPKILVPVILALLLIFFLFGPFASFLRSYIQTMKERGGTEVTVDSKFEGGPEGGEGAGKEIKEGGALTEETLTPEELEELEKEKYIPFNYVTDETLRQLIYLIRREKPRNIALVVSYLKPEYVTQVLSSLPPELQAQVAVEMATVRLMTQEELMSYDADLKNKIDFVIGGLDHLLQVLEKVDRITLENILEYLKNENPDLYDKVRKFIITFDDIPNFPDPAMQAIIRELKSESIARALRNAGGEVSNKFFANMSASAAAILKEEMEYGRPATDEEIEEERRKIVELVKQLEKDGKVFIREKPGNAILEGSDVVVDEAVATTAAAGYEDYNQAGIASYGAGNYEEALSYFEYCAGLEGATAQLYEYLGGTYYALGRTADAVSAYQRALELNPGNEQLKLWLKNNKKGG